MKQYLHILVNVNSVWTFKYLLWLIQETDGREVSIGVASYRAFFAYLHRNGIKPPSERTMRIVLAEMIHDNIVFRQKGNIYRISPFIVDDLPDNVGQATVIQGNMSTDGHVEPGTQDEVSVNQRDNQESNNQ